MLSGQRQEDNGLLFEVDVQSCRHSSSYCFTFLDSDVGNYDRVVIQDLLKEVAQTQQVDASAQKRFKGALPSPTFAVIT